MAYLVRMPQMGMSMDEGTVVEWAVAEGGEIEAGETLVVVESEKSQADVEARETGVLRRVLVAPGEVVGPGDPIGIVAAPDEDLADLEADLADLDGVEPTEASADSPSGTTPEVETAPVEAPDDVKATPGARELADESGVDLADVAGSGPGGAITERDVRAAAPPADEGSTAPDLKATPGARRFAERAGVALDPVEGTGPGGAIIEDDVRAAASATDPAPAEEAAGTPHVRERRSLSGPQETVSRRLGESYRNAVHVTLNRTIDTDAMDGHVDAARTLGMGHGYTDLILRAAADALAAHPEFNAHFDDGEHVLFADVNIGLAVDVDGRLLTPVIANVDERDLGTLNEVRAELVDRVGSGEFTMDDLAGATFTVSNLGMFGVDDFDPIIDPPQVAILGVGRRRDDATMTLSLSFDHRVNNGVAAAKFLDAIVGCLTDSETLSGYLR